MASATSTPTPRPRPDGAAPAAGRATGPGRVRFPLWSKLGLVFGGMLGAFVALYGWLGFQSDMAAEAAARRAKLTGLATTLASAVDADAHGRLRVPGDVRRPEYDEIRALLMTAREANALTWVGTTAPDDRGRWSFVVDGGAVAPYPIGYPIFDGAEFRRRAVAEGTSFDSALQDEWGTWITAAAPIVGADGQAHRRRRGVGGRRRRHARRQTAPAPPRDPDPAGVHHRRPQRGPVRPLAQPSPAHPDRQRPPRGRRRPRHRGGHPHPRRDRRARGRLQHHGARDCASASTSARPSAATSRPRSPTTCSPSRAGGWRERSAR